MKVVGRFMVVFALVRPEGGCRLGITATRKFGGAVVRNRARRRVRALFRGEAAVRDGLRADLVVNVRHGCDEVGWDRLREDYLECLGRIRHRLRPPAP